MTNNRPQNLIWNDIWDETKHSIRTDAEFSGTISVDAVAIKDGTDDTKKAEVIDGALKVTFTNIDGGNAGSTY